MWHFNTQNELYTETKTYLAALASCAIFTTYQQAQLAAMHAKMATTTTFYAAGTAWRLADSGRFIWAVKNLMSKKAGSTD